MAKTLFYLFFIFFLIPPSLFAQDIELYQQFNGRYDYMGFGNTLNKEENNKTSDCSILTQSSANLNLSSSQNVIGAYLYWSGSGTGDFDVKLNGVPITADRTFAYNLIFGSNTIPFFAAFTDVTQQVQSTGNGNYTLSDLDLTAVLVNNPIYCGQSINYGGWVIIVIYEDQNLPYNQINLYDGLEGLHGQTNTITILLDHLNVVSNIGAKIGYLAWEGDTGPNHSINETIKVNSNVLVDHFNPPINPPNDIFNNTNAFTGSNTFWNMDLDYFYMDNHINAGDTTIDLEITSGNGNQGDFVMINNIITVVNSELPDATIEIVDLIAGEECGERDIFIEYAVYNLNSTAVLPANTSIGFFANTTLIGTSATAQAIPIGGSESGSMTITLPATIPKQFDLVLLVDYDDQVKEIDETNNEDRTEITLRENPVMTTFIDQLSCFFISNTYDLTQSTPGLDPLYIVSYHTSEVDAENNINAIPNPENFENTTNPQTIYVRVYNGDCFLIGTFDIGTLKCPDATITIDNDLNACRQRELLIEYTVYNTNGSGPLPTATPIAFYIDNVLVAQSQTQAVIPIGGQLQQSITIELSDNVPDVFELKLVVDDIGDGTGVVQELDETNNEYSIIVTFGSIDGIPPLDDMIKCNEGFGNAEFDLTKQYEFITQDLDDEISFYSSYTNALSKTDPIVAPHIYQSASNPETIYVRLENEICFTIADFMLSTKDCPPKIPQGFSPNNDNINDYFHIDGLLDIFPDHEIKIYTRKGNLIFIGNNQTGFWDGNANTGLIYSGPVPVGVYYYVLNLNHPDYRPFIGWVYLNK